MSKSHETSRVMKTDMLVKTVSSKNDLIWPLRRTRLRQNDRMLMLFRSGFLLTFRKCGLLPHENAFLWKSVLPKSLIWDVFYRDYIEKQKYNITSCVHVIGVRVCPYGICCPWVRGGWGLDGLGKFFRRRRRRRRRPRIEILKSNAQKCAALRLRILVHLIS